MHTYLRNKPAWLQLIIFGGLVGGIFVVSLLLGVGLVAKANHMTYLQISTLTPQDYARPALAGVIRGMLIVQFFGIFLLPSLVFSYLADPRPLAYAGLKAPQKNTFLILGLVTMIAAYFTVEFLGTINEAAVHYLPKGMQQWVQSGEADANGILENILSLKTPAELVGMIILVAALPAIGEELFFRGILQKIFIQIFKKAWPGIIFTGFLFSAFHMQFLGLLPRMALGIILGSLYWYTGSLYTSILGHFIYNTINIFLIYFKVADLNSKSSSGVAFSLIGVVSMSVVVLLINYLRKKSTTSYDVEFPTESDNILFDDQDHRV